ncbi:MAG: hypothetical protein WCG75_00830 [Armatimonadota bacterium]
MSDRYVKEVDVVESSSSNALIILVVAIIAIAVIAMVVWQPWVAPQTPSNSTTIIKETQTPATTPDNRPIIVNPPPATQGDTKIDIHNSVTPPPTKTDTNSNNGGGANNDAGSNNSA